MPKVLFQLYIDIEQFNYIKGLSDETGWSRAAIVREMVDYYKKVKEKEEEQTSPAN